MNGTINENPSMKLYDFETAVGAAAESYPESYHLSRAAAVKNQGNISACCGCAMATIAEYAWGAEFSEGWNYAEFRRHEGKGLYMQTALDMWLKLGTVPFADFGILREMPEIRTLAEAHPELSEIAAKYTICGYASLNYADRKRRDNAVKQAIMSGVPVLASITYLGGGHAIAVDGWDDAKGVYTYQNSYGRDWGEGGYGTIGKDKLNDAYAVFFEGPELPFSDIPGNRWSHSAIKHMYMNGLMRGATDTEFEPERAMTREELAAVLDRLCDMLDARLERIYKIMNEAREGQGD